MADEQPKDSVSAPPPEERSRPIAWQPLTPGGVAAFAASTFSRVLLVQLLIAALVAATVVWFFAGVWFPVFRQGIGRLPPKGAIVYGELNWAGQPFEIVLEDRPFLIFIVDLENRSRGNTGIDLSLRFCKKQLEICSPFGCTVVPYQKEYQVEFNRPEVESWWGAWQPIILGWTAVLVPILLMVTWAVLATLYFVPAWLLALYTNRQLSWGGSWRLASAALMPGAVIMIAAIFLYGWAVLDFMHLLLVTGVHIVAGWVYLIAATLKLPRVEKRKKNPFTPETQSAPVQKESNPFASASSPAQASDEQPDQPPHQP